MSNKNKNIAQWGFYLLIGLLLAYAASRTLHFVQNVMDNATQGYLFLFATGIGALIWLYVYLTYAEGSKQRAIAWIMGLADLAGELALVYADTIYVGDKAGLVKMSADEMHTFILVSVGMVGINILAGYLFKLSDLKAEQDQHAQDLVDHVTDETMKHLNTPEAKAQMVQELLPIYKSAIASRVQAEVFSRSSQHQGLDAQTMGWPMPKQATTSVAKMLPKNWTCGVCGENNLFIRATCIKCGEERGAPYPRSETASIHHPIEQKDEQSQSAQPPFQPE